MRTTGSHVHRLGSRPSLGWPSAGTLRLAAGILAILVAVLTLWSNPSDAQTPDAQTSPAKIGKGTRVKPGEASRVFVMAGFTPDACAFIGYPEMQLEARPSKGQVSFKQGEATTIQYSLSGKCIGTQMQGTGIYYTPVAGQSGADAFTVSGRLGSGEPATRTFSVIIDENGNVE